MSTQNKPTIVVGRVDVATAQATGVSTLLPKSIVFSDAGDIQAITAVGNVVDVGTSANAALLAANNTFTGRNIFQPAVATSGSAFAIKVTGAANTAQATTVEAPDVFLSLARTVTWAAGNIMDQRAVKVTAPTYVVSGGASTITTASTMSLSGAPVAGATTILARSYSLLVESGVTNLAGGVGLSNATNNDAAVCLTVRRLVDSAASGVAGVGAGGVGGVLSFEAPNDAGTQTLSGVVIATLDSVAAGTEVGELSLGGAYGGASREALRLVGVAGVITNRIDITPAADSGIVTVAVTGGATAGSLALSCNGVAVPRFQVLSGGDEPLDPGMDFPLFVKPIGEGSSIGISAKSLVKNEADLRAVARELIAAHRQPVIVEEYIEGKEVTVALLGNPPRVLPIVEIEFSHLPEGVPRFDCYEVKWIYEDRIACPAPIDEATRSKVEATALAAFGALGCRDLCRIDMRIDSDGDPYVIDVNALPGLIPDPKEHSRFPAACYAAGMSYDDIIRNILEVAMARCGVKA